MSKDNDKQVLSILSRWKIKLLKNDDIFNTSVKKKRVNYDICLAFDDSTLEEIIDFRKIGYKDMYPKMDLKNEPLDHYALILFTRNTDGAINSTARLTINGGPEGFPQEEFLTDYRKSGMQLIELGRLIIDVDNRELLKAYYRAFYRIAINLQCIGIVMSIKRKDVRLHKRLVDLNILEEDTENYGGDNKLDTAIWIINKTKGKFFKWAKGGKQ